MAALSSSDVETIFLALVVVAFAVGVWRAALRDVLGTVLCAAIGLVILLVAL